MIDYDAGIRKVIVSQISDTQRVTVKDNSERDSVQITKEFRKNEKESWSASKGINIPNKDVPNLIETLKNVKKR